VTKLNDPARILVVDDSVVVRGLVSRLVDAEDDLEIASTAPDGAVAVRKVEQYDPDLVILDLEMPVMSGLEALDKIRETWPALPVVVFTSLTDRPGSSPRDILARGASACVAKPTGAADLNQAIHQVRDELLSEIRNALHKPREAQHTKLQPAVPTHTKHTLQVIETPAQATTAEGLHRSSIRLRPSTQGRIDAVVLACSTGGPAALEQVLISLIDPLPVPMFIVQHMPPNFTKELAARLDKRCASTVVEASEGMRAEPGYCYIAPGGLHMFLSHFQLHHTSIHLNEAPQVNSVRPSAEPLFSSASEVYGGRVLVTVLTGMGFDGLEGSRTLADLGCDVIVQDEETSVVWGMPGGIAEAGIATHVLPLPAIGPRLAQLVQQRSRP